MRQLTCSRYISYRRILALVSSIHFLSFFLGWWRPMVEIRLNMFGSPDMPVFPAILVSDGDSVYSRQTLFQIMVQGQLVPRCFCLDSGTT